MSPMAKIFVVVNLVFAVVAFGSAATLLGAKEDYKAANAKLTTQFDNYKSMKTKEIERLERDLGAQQNRASQALADKANAEGNLEDAKKQLAEISQANKQAQATNANLAAQLKALQATNAAFKDWLEKYAGEAGAATKDKLNFKNKWEAEVQNRVRLEAEVKKTAEERDELAAQNGDLDKKVRSLEFWLAKYRERFGDITGGPKGANGVVKRVRGDLVSISVGKGDGVRVGDTYQIRRGATYVGQVKITHVYKDQSVGEFDSQFKGPGAPPAAGDIAEARLGG